MAQVGANSITADFDYEVRMPLAQLLEQQPTLTLTDCRPVIDEGLMLLAGMYVHLPTKRALYGVDPEAKLRLYRQQLDDLWISRGPEVEPLDFHRSMALIFASLHDRHTRYWTPKSLRSWDAFLPFDVETYWDGASRRYVISRIENPRSRQQSPLQDAELTHWNGVPADRVIRALSETTAGANLEAQWARGVQLLTRRPLCTTPAPDEDWVEITVVSGRRQARSAHRFQWSAGRLPAPQRTTRRATGTSKTDAFGLDSDAERVLHGKRVLVRHPVETLETLKAHAEFAVARPLVVDGVELAYLRIYSFHVPDDDGFVSAIQRTLKELPQNGLIVDIRGNPGGSVMAAERMLQLFKPVEVEPQLLQMRATDDTVSLAAAAPTYGRWKASLSQTIWAGGYSAGYPCGTDLNVYRDLGAAYTGPAVLIVDALTYSAAEFFAAGWKDNGIGDILGTDTVTGGGGATVLTSVEVTNRRLQRTDRKGADTHRFTVAVRRSQRVHSDFTGMLVEDFGVQADGTPYRLTRQDVTGNNDGLFAEAAARLG